MRNLNNQISNVSSHYNRHSDHHGIRLTFRTDETVVGKGLWKMNNENILTEEFKQQFSEMWVSWQNKKESYKLIVESGCIE